MFKVPFLLSAVFALFIVATRARLARQRFPWLQVAYAATFVGMSTMVISTLATLYAQAVQDKAIAVADTLGGRINDIVAADLALQDFSGLDKAFADYQRLGADISNAALISDGRVMIHTNPDRVGKPWRADPASYEYFVKLGSSTHNADVSIALSVPRDVVYRQVGRSVKNFLALFVASAFLAGLFLQVAVSLKNSGRDKALTSAGLVAAENEAALTAVKPLFFVAVFLEHMTYSFLPQYMQGLAAASGASTAFASMPFMMYYLFFALALIPSGYLAQNIGPRALMNVGLLLCGVGLVALLLPIDLWIAIGARAISGIGQGMLFIGVQSYILASASPERRTQGNAIIVFGFQGGMISGMAIGSLLVIYMGEKGVFELAAVLAMVTALYGFILVPDAPARALAFSSLSQTMSRLVQDLRCVVRNGQFMRTMLLVGIPAKATLTGIITFALPLMLSQQEYKQEDIGQIIMLYALGVVLASHYVARLVDRIGQTSRILSWGAAAAGVGTLIVGLSNLGPHGGGAAFGGNLPTMVLIAGVIVIGMAHGCINAPVVTHVAELGLTRAIGVDSTTATYRFLERIGHVMGPIIVGQMFLASGTSPTAIAWFGATTAFLGIVFLLGASLNPGGTGTSERIA
jgi:MFS family permease